MVQWFHSIEQTHKEMELNQKSELLESLEIMERLMLGDATRSDLQGDSPRSTFNRRLAYARHLGAVIVTVRDLAGSVYRLENADVIRERGTLAAWLRIERARSVV